MDASTLRHAETVKRMAGNGMSQRDIAKVTDLSLATVNRLVNYDPGSVKGTLAHMIALEDKRRVKRDEIYEAYHAGDQELLSRLEDELRAIV